MMAHGDRPGGYELRIRDVQSWERWTVDSVPSAAGGAPWRHSELGGLSPEREYAVTLSAGDDAGNWSLESEPLTFRTGTQGDEFWWDGFAPAPEGAGLPDAVSSLVVHDGYLVAGMSPRNDGDRLVYRWDGAAWEVLGDGQLWEASPGSPSTAELIAAGHFFFIRQHPLAAHRSMGWGAAGGGLGPGVNGPVTDLLVYHDNLIVAGRVLRRRRPGVGPVCARWDGEAWSP